MKIMPDTLFGEAGVFKTRSLNFYADLRTAIINHMVTKCLVSTNINNARGSDFEQRRSRRTR